MKDNKRNIGNVLGIVAEYNPFHNGHKYQLEQCKEISKADFVVAIMSGNFTQRGEPALLDKWKRAEIAVENGIDLVIELPIFYVLNGANIFAKGAIKTLKSLGCVSHLGFGSESGDISKLIKLANIMTSEDDDFENVLKIHLDDGLSYKKAFSKAVRSVYGIEYEKLLTSNNILAAEYILNSKSQDAPFEFITVERAGQRHDEILNFKENDGKYFTQEDIVFYLENFSGKNIREILKKIKEEKLIDKFQKANIKWLPEKTKYILEREFDNLWLDDFYRINNLVKYNSLCRERDYWKNRASWEEGMEGKFINSIRCDAPDKILEKLTSKRYSRSRIRKYVLQVLMDIKKNDEPDEYIRVLGFNDKGAKLLKVIKKNNLVRAEVITKVAKAKSDISLDIRGTDFYNLIMKRDVYENSDFVKLPFIDK